MKQNIQEWLKKKAHFLPSLAVIYIAVQHRKHEQMTLSLCCFSETLDY